MIGPGDAEPVGLSQELWTGGAIFPGEDGEEVHAVGVPLGADEAEGFEEGSALLGRERGTLPGELLGLEDLEAELGGGGFVRAPGGGGGGDGDGVLEGAAAAGIAGRDEEIAAAGEEGKTVVVGVRVAEVGDGARLAGAHTGGAALPAEGAAGERHDGVGGVPPGAQDGHVL